MPSRTRRQPQMELDEVVLTDENLAAMIAEWEKLEGPAQNRRQLMKDIKAAIPELSA